MHLGSRKQLRRESDSVSYGKNLRLLCHQHGQNEVADPDTLAYYAERVEPCQVERVLAWLTTRMIRMRTLDAHRLDGYYTVAIDGTQICTFDQQPWEGAPHRKHKGGTERQYFAYVLDAKLVTPSGLKYSWKYIITFKRGSMPERYSEAETVMTLQEGNRQECRTPGLIQQLCWATDIAIEEFSPAVLWCTDQPDGAEEKRFGWLTNFDITRNNAARIANKGGRLRWKIENEGFNTQKKNGYEMEHLYSKHANGLQVFYLYLLLAHYLNQLILLGSLLESLVSTFGSAKNFARRLTESLRHDEVAEPLVLPGQIRLRPP